MQGKTRLFAEKLLHSRLSVELLLSCTQKFLYADAHGNTIILALCNVCEQVNRFINWIFKDYCLFLISSTKEHEHLAFTSEKQSTAKYSVA